MAIHDYDTGYRYSDYVEGDKLAGYGVGALVASILGVKFGKGFLLALLGGILVFGKKILAVAAAIVVAAGAIIMRSRRKAAALPPSAPPPPAGPPPAAG
jgi:uncharacterized membrane-anchored protein